MAEQDITSWGGWALAAAMAFLGWVPKIAGWLAGARESHYRDLKDFIEKLNVRIGETERKVEDCEKRHHETQTQYGNMIVQFSTQMDLLRQQNQSFLLDQQKDKLIAQATAEALKAHPGLLDAMKDIDKKE